MAGLRERAVRHGRSMQQEIREILKAAAVRGGGHEALEPIRLNTVRTAGTSTWRREEIYGAADR